jgi:hypothetical protein
VNRTGDDIRRLVAELRFDAEQVDILLASNTRASDRINAGATDYLDFSALGYTIHNLYSIMENSCLRIAKFFENSISDSAWHKDLLERMRLDIDQVRPAFLDEQTYLYLDDLRAFRHVFRNLYARPIDKDKIMLVQAKVEPACNAFHRAVERYHEFLQSLTEITEE